jgi:hypothetical protein
VVVRGFLRQRRTGLRASSSAKVSAPCSPWPFRYGGRNFGHAASPAEAVGRHKWHRQPRRKPAGQEAATDRMTEAGKEFANVEESLTQHAPRIGRRRRVGDLAASEPRDAGSNGQPETSALVVRSRPGAVRTALTRPEGGTSTAGGAAHLAWRFQPRYCWRGRVSSSWRRSFPDGRSGIPMATEARTPVCGTRSWRAPFPAAQPRRR